ncbi:MAG: FtsX-like permease family protein, partial [Kordiimonadaceae bacterium]|nr:FtsX-like permease family protein [Kordiimonadaceae bacterium]
NEAEVNETVGFVDVDFFEVFDLPMVAGVREQVFQDNASIIINEENARKYFGTKDPIGEVLYIKDNDQSYKVVAVMKDLPDNTHLDLEMLTWFDTSRFINQPSIAESWISHNTFEYLRLNSAELGQIVEDKFPDYLNSQLDMSALGRGDAQATDLLSIDLMPLEDIHLHSVSMQQMKSSGDINVVYNFSAIAFLVLVVACINFMNLSTSRSFTRAKEVAIRKVCGASRGQVATQFLTEALLITMIAGVISILLVAILLPIFGQFIEKVLSLNLINDPSILLSITALIILVGLGAGAYPSLYVSSFRPVEILKGNKSKRGSSGLMRTFMVTLQFSIAIGLILMTAVMYFQVDYAQNKVLGFEKDNKYLLYSNLDEDSFSALETIRAEYLDMPEIVNVAASNRQLPISGDRVGRVKLLDGETNEMFIIDRMTGDYNFLPFYDSKLLAGRLFSPDYQADIISPIEGEDNSYSRTGIINQAALDYMGFKNPENALGKIMVINEVNSDERTLSTIIGVVADTNFASLHSPIRPMIFQAAIEDLWVISLEYDRAKRANLMETIDNKWMEISSTTSAPSSNYLDTLYNFYYQADEERMKTFAFFSSFAIFVACLGLYGLASFEAEQRTKEIGIRKVMGARVKDIVALMVWQFSKPVLLANLIAWPIAWYFISEWLTGFEYRIELVNHLYLFIVASVLALLIAWLTVAIHAFSIAHTNPIKALRYE